MAGRANKLKYFDFGLSRVRLLMNRTSVRGMAIGQIESDHKYPNSNIANNVKIKVPFYEKYLNFLHICKLL